MFVGVHVMLAMQTQTPELAISDDEGKAFLGAAQNVARHYSVETTQKTLDWIAFVGVSVSMYGTRSVAIMTRHRAERANKSGSGSTVRDPPGGASVLNFKGARASADFHIQPAEVHPEGFEADG